MIALYIRHLDDNPIFWRGCLSFAAAWYYCAGVIRCHVTATSWLSVLTCQAPPVLPNLGPLHFLSFP